MDGQQRELIVLSPPLSLLSSPCHTVPHLHSKSRRRSTRELAGAGVEAMLCYAYPYILYVPCWTELQHGTVRTVGIWGRGRGGSRGRGNVHRVISSHLITPYHTFRDHNIPYIPHTHTLTVSSPHWLAGWLHESSLLMTAVIILIYNNYEDDWYVNKKRMEEKNCYCYDWSDLIWSDDRKSERQREREREQFFGRFSFWISRGREYGHVSQIKKTSLHLHSTENNAMTAPDYAPTFCGLRHINHATIYGWRGVG